MLKKLFVVAAIVAASSGAMAESGQLGSGQIVGNSGASSAPGSPTSVTAILDRALGSTRGAILERGASGWAMFSPSATARVPYLSGGTGADPLYGAYTLPASVTSGGVACFTSTTTEASSGLLSANAIILGGGAGTCPSPMGSLGTTNTVLHGNASGPPAFSSVVSADMNITATNCTNQLVSAISTGGVGTCTGLTLASAQFANQGTTTTVLHGNAAGNPSFGAVNLATDVMGTAPTGNGGSGANNSTNNAGDLLASNGANGNFVATALNAICPLVPSVCTSMLGYTSIAWYGAKCDGIFQSNQNFDQPATNISITSGQNVLTSSGSTFTSADVGKRVWIPFGGAASADYGTTIDAFINATQVHVVVAASSTVTTQAATNAHPFVYGTDDTTAIQNAINGTPTGGTLVIPGKSTGCVIRQQGGNAYALTQTRPFNVRGQGHMSNLMTFPDTPSGVDNFLVNNAIGGDWTSFEWTGFSISAMASFAPPSFLMEPRYGNRGLAFVDVTSATNFPQIKIDNVTIGQSANNYALYIGNATSSGSQGDVISRNHIYGGIHLANVSDSFIVRDNFLYGSTVFGGLFELIAGSGEFAFINNNVTWTGCTIIEGSSKPVVINNYFEEVVNGANCARAAFVDFNGGLATILYPTFTGNIVNVTVSTATPVRYNNVTGGIFGDNYLSEGTARTFVTSVTTLSCTAPNFWNGGGTHFSGALANTYGGC